MVKEKIIIINETGLHARPASVLVKEASKYKCDINIELSEKVTNMKSIMGIISLGISKGDEISIIADGEDENVALKNIIEIIKSGFHE